ncbi:MAG: sugar ABC transporter permease [Lachnospiraceae bacterium]|nr:sugar ABC transporter permease [Lachnospiraceae bacterium]
MNKAKLLAGLKKYTMIIALVVITIFFAWRTEGKILLPMNITNLIAQNAYVYVLATGMLLCILTGGNIDLSVGSVVCFVGAIGASLMEKGMNVVLAVLVMLVAGAIIGAFQGYWIAYQKVPPFIATLAGMLAFRGLANVVLDGRTVSITNKAFINAFGGGADCYIPDFFGGTTLNLTCMAAGILACVIYVGLQVKNHMDRVKKGYEAESMGATAVKAVLICIVIVAFSYKLAMNKGIPTALLWIILVVLVYGYVTTKTRIGRYLYAVGGNEKATKLSGINTENVYFIAYVNMGLLAGLAGILTIARMTSSQPTYGQSYEMDAIGSCFIGGASAYGGVGTVSGVVVGATLMGVINLGMSIMGVDANYQKVVKGLVLLFAVIFDVVSKKENSK